MAKADNQIIYYKGEVISKSPKNAVAYNILKHMVETNNYTFNQLENIFNNKKIKVGTSELIKNKEKLSQYYDKAENDGNGNSKSRKRSFLPNRECDFLNCRDKKWGQYSVWSMDRMET